MNDCQKGIVFDGLESLFTQNTTSSAHIMLKALNNRKYLYSVSLKLDYGYIKKKDEESKKEKGLNYFIKIGMKRYFLGYKINLACS